MSEAALGTRRPDHGTGACCGTVPEVVFVENPAPEKALGAWREALAGQAAVSVLDPTWPAGLRESALRVVEEAWRSHALSPRDLVLFTSGSSGRPRAVHRSRRSWEASAAPFSAAVGLSAGRDVVAIPGPLSSTLFSFGAWHALSQGCEVVAARLDDLATHPRSAAVTLAHAVPAMLPALFEAAARGALPGLRTVVVAGDALPPATRPRAEELGLRLVEYYGAAELSLVGIRDDDGPLKPFEGVEIEVREGLLWSRSPYGFLGYLGEQGPLTRDTAGWACVGDLASTVAGGFVVRGRGDAAVSTGGHTVVVEEVERFLRGVPGVTDAGVAGAAHPRLGERVVAVVQGSVSEADLRAACRSLPAPARPRAFVWAQVPRGRTGKVLREELRALAGRGAASGHAMDPVDGRAS